MSAVTSDPWRRFVRQTLGCGCPEEVLDSIRCESGLLQETGHSRLRLDVGGRLLVWILAVDEGEQRLGGVIVTAIRQGRAERDGAGFNRFRLVLACDAPAAIGAAAEAAFASLHDLDDRVHLHVVAAEDLPTAATPQP
jgi:hypothetical protein